MRHTTYPVEERSQSNGLLPRLSTTRSTRQPVMCGVLGVSCMRYGVSDTNLSRDTQMFRYTPSCRTKCALSCLDLFQAIKMVDGGQRLAPPPGCPRAIYKLMINCWSVTPQTTLSIICTCIISPNRNPVTSERPSSDSLSQSLARPDPTLLKWEASDKPAGVPEALVLGAPLDSASLLYPDLQRVYLPPDLTDSDYEEPS